MFWGITLDVGKRYTQTVEKSFHLSMAALGFNNTTSNPVTVLVEVDKAQFALCTLQPGKIPQQTLDIAFTEGEEITFSTEGNNEVHLTGYLVEEPEAVDVDDMEDFSMESEESASESESNESSSENEEDGESSDNPVTLQHLLVGENVAEEDEQSDDDWDPCKDNPSPKKKTKSTKKSPKHKNIKNSESNGKNISNGSQQEGGLTSLLFSELLPSSDDESEDYTPNKIKKGQQVHKSLGSKKKGKKRKLQENNETEITKTESEKSKKAKKRTHKVGRE